ncbi:hypothetical protein MCUN1_001817 [Malassezia cuniculi]|uniref:Growth hormone-inducible transmembrane protein n=1 Tax=Malassezia cuniculi TaxID=948313 RepID=A0AAF0EQZ5_9BASI|nr:hypothetical protein MCUN1_001817 [Malassezia cuniculi]
MFSIRPLSRAVQPAARAALGSRSIVTRSARPAVQARPVLEQVRFVRNSPFGRHSPSQRTTSAAWQTYGTPVQAAPQATAQNGWGKALVSVGLIAGTAIGANLFLNRETRDSLSVGESQYLNSTFSYLGGGLAITGGFAYAFHRFGYAARIMFANPWLVMGVGLVASIGGMIGAQSLPPSHPLKAPCWLLFNVSQAAVLSPLFFLNPAILARAGLYTAGVVGSLCYVGATAKQDQYLYLGGPLLAGVAVVALSSLAPMVLPVTAMRTLAATEAISLYGGLAVFGGFVLWDTQKVLHHARLVEAGLKRPDPMAESIGLELDFINIFTRIVQILAMNDSRRRR